MPSSDRAHPSRSQRCCLPGSFTELVWTLGKWNGNSSGALPSLHLRPGVGRWSRELLALAGMQYARRSVDLPESESFELDPLHHLLTGNPLSEWLAGSSWEFPNLAVSPVAPPEGGAVILCLGTELTSERLPPAAWARTARWLEEWVGPVQLVGEPEDTGLGFEASRLGSAGMAGTRLLPLVAAPLTEVIGRMKTAAAVVGPLGGLTVLAACLGVPTVIGYPKEFARIEGLWEPEGTRVASCPLTELGDRLEAGELNPGWALRPSHQPTASGSQENAPPTTAQPTPGSHPLVAPLGVRDHPRAWAGRAARKPWEYRVTAVIPHLDTLEPVRACVELLRLQTEPPYILIIDTGSPDRVRAALEALRAEDLEIHYLRAHGYVHPSEPVAVAQDLAFALCRSEFLFCTHADCFLRRRDYLRWLLTLCSPEQPAVGYQMSPRDWLTDQWEGMVSHTATMLHMPSMHRLGVTWSMERARCAFGLNTGVDAGWPDTETCMNLVLRAAGVQPLLIGPETNYQRHVDENLDHVRSYPGSQVYSADYHRQAKEWMESALEEAWNRVARWRCDHSWSVANR